MKIFIYANCQWLGFKALLPDYLNSDDIKIDGVENYLLANGSKRISDVSRQIMEADLIIYQPVGSQHGFLSTEDAEANILGLARQTCHKVSIPYVYNDGLWPCIPEGDDFVKNGSAIDDVLSQGAEDADLDLLYDRGDLVFGLKDRFEASLQQLETRERDLDVKASHLILENFKGGCVLLTQNHPTDFVFRHMADQIATLIGERRRGARIERPAALENTASLPGLLPIDAYCIKELDMVYEAPDANASVYYKSVLRLQRSIYIKSKQQREAVMMAEAA